LNYKKYNEKIYDPKINSISKQIYFHKKYNEINDNNNAIKYNCNNSNDYLEFNFDNSDKFIKRIKEFVINKL
jgi:hypothetical protein